MRKNKFVFLLLVGLAVVSSSCVSSRNVRYVRDMEDMKGVPLTNSLEAVVCPNDELRITVLSSGDDESMLKPFNIYGGSSMGGSQNGMGYLVDVNGNIEFPVLGEVHIEGLTRLQVRDTIQSMLKTRQLLDDPQVDVRFLNYKIFFLGSQGGKSISINNERCTFLEALALSGDLDLYTKRDRIGVLREVDGKMVIHYMDPRSSEVFNDPFFMLQQNDIIITEAMGYVYFKEFMGNVGVVLGSITTLASIAALYISIRTLINSQSGK